MNFIKPSVTYIFDIKKDDPFKDLVGIKVYNKPNTYLPKKYQSSEELRERYKEFKSYYFSHSRDTVGKLISAEGNYIRDIKLNECVNFKRSAEEYLNESTYTKPVKEYVHYEIYKGLKFKMKDNHLHQWFTKEEMNRFDAPVPQKLDEEGYVVMVEDNKTHIVVNYGTHLIQQELKEVYCSVNGRYIKYKGKNYYIKEQ
ncbi:hypothetical protein CHH57_02065 [Niallia circulans]|uniref:Uncharacterized protein n=1 Tax=Niallia circulans TaxID=1397 RepID=A0AA91Z2J4_NIACI|nr:hypothetical protein [Niallia circulans]PAD84983.1 hypothetical protein CHH57_02065 [Niallia circulans]